jgi:hypothetical protein
MNNDIRYDHDAVCPLNGMAVTIVLAIYIPAGEAGPNMGRELARNGPFVDISNQEHGVGGEQVAHRIH